MKALLLTLFRPLILQVLQEVEAHRDATRATKDAEDTSRCQAPLDDYQATRQANLAADPFCYQNPTFEDLAERPLRPEVAEWAERYPERFLSIVRSERRRATDEAHRARALKKVSDQIALAPEEFVAQARRDLHAV